MIKKCKEHLETVNESYFQHMRFAMKYGFCCFKAGFMVITHALLPCFFETSASDQIKKLAGCVDEKNKRKDFVSPLS